MYIRYAFIKLYIYIYDNIRYTYINIYISNIFAVKKKKKKKDHEGKKKKPSLLSYNLKAPLIFRMFIFLFHDEVVFL